MSVGVSVWPGSQIIYVIFGHFIQWQFAQKKQVVELLSRRRWRLVSAQLSNQFGYCPLYTVSIVLLVHKRNSLPLGHIQAFISRKLPCSPNKCTKCYRNFWQMWNKPSKLPDFSKFGKYRKIWSHCRVCVYLKITESEKEEVECPSIFLKQTVRRKKWSGKRRRRRRFLSTLYCNVNVVCLCHFCLSQQDLEKERKRRKSLSQFLLSLWDSFLPFRWLWWWWLLLLWPSVSLFLHPLVQLTNVFVFSFNAVLSCLNGCVFSLSYRL